jgi:hypothetical protein
MRGKSQFVIVGTVLLLGTLVSAVFISAQSSSALKADDVMTAEELNDTGLSTLTSVQRRAFDAWLNRYTTTVYNIAANQRKKQPTPRYSDVKSGCAPAIESNISGDFNGWEGETVFKLDNGQIWEQAEYDYTYSYSYRPDVTIYQVSGGCRMKVEDEEETILVRRIK